MALAGCIALSGAMAGAVMADDAHAQSDSQTFRHILDDTGAIRLALDIGRPPSGGSGSELLTQIRDDTGAIRLALGVGDDSDSGSIFDLFGSIFGSVSDSQKIADILADTGAIRRALDIGRPEPGGSDSHKIAHILADTGAIRHALDTRSAGSDPSDGPLTLVAVSAALSGTAFDALDGPSGLDVFDVNGRTYAVVAAFHGRGVQIMDITDPTSTIPISDVFRGQGGFEALSAPAGVAVFDSGENALAIVADHAGGIQIIDVTYPANPAPVSALFDDTNGFEALGGAWGVAAFGIGDRTYAMVAGRDDNGVQIIDVTYPASPSPTSAVFDGSGGFEALAEPTSVAVFGAGDRTYAVVAGAADDGVQIIDVTDPAAPVPVSSAFDGSGGFEALAEPTSVAVFGAGDRTYAVVAGAADDGVQIIDVTDPAAPVPVSSAFDGSGGFEALAEPTSVAVFGAGDRTYAVVAGAADDGVQIIDVTDPAAPVPASAVFDGSGGFEALAEPFYVGVFEAEGGAHAVVAGRADNGVQVIDMTDPTSPAPASAAFDGSVGHGGFDAMADMFHVHPYEVNGGVYAIVAGYASNGIQIIDVTDPQSPTPASSVFDGSGGFEALVGPTGLDVFIIGDRRYAIVACSAEIDDEEYSSVQIMDVTDPAAPAPISVILDDTGGFSGLNGAHDAHVFWNEGRAYAIVSAFYDGFQIMDVTDPAAPVPVSAAHGGEGGFGALDKASEMDVFTMDGRLYAMVLSWAGGAHIIDITDPASPVPVSAAYDDAGGFEALDKPEGVDVFETEDGAYAIVTSGFDDGVQIMDITDPASPVPVSAAYDGEGGFEALGWAAGVAVFEAGGSVYAMVAGWIDNGVQIIDVTDPASPTPVDAIFDNTEGFTALAEPQSVDLFETGGRTYAIVGSWGDVGIQIIEVSVNDAPR